MGARLTPGAGGMDPWQRFLRMGDSQPQEQEDTAWDRFMRMGEEPPVIDFAPVGSPPPEMRQPVPDIPLPQVPAAVRQAGQWLGDRAAQYQPTGRPTTPPPGHQPGGPSEQFAAGLGGQAFFGAARAVPQTREFIEQTPEPQTLGEKAARGAGRLAGNIPNFMLTGAAVRPLVSAALAPAAQRAGFVGQMSRPAAGQVARAIPAAQTAAATSPSAMAAYGGAQLGAMAGLGEGARMAVEQLIEADKLSPQEAAARLASATAGGVLSGMVFGAVAPVVAQKAKDLYWKHIWPRFHKAGPDTTGHIASTSAEGLIRDGLAVRADSPEVQRLMQQGWQLRDLSVTHKQAATGDKLSSVFLHKEGADGGTIFVIGGTPQAPRMMSAAPAPSAPTAPAAPPRVAGALPAGASPAAPAVAAPTPQVPATQTPATPPAVAPEVEAPVSAPAVTPSVDTIIREGYNDGIGGMPDAQSLDGRGIPTGRGRVHPEPHAVQRVDAGRGPETQGPAPGLIQIEPQRYVEAVSQFKETHPYGAFTSVPDEGMEGSFLMSEDGLSGIVVQDGHLGSLFSANKQGHAMILEGLERGGNRMDCFDGFLPSLYARYGFMPVARLKFDREYAPANWNYERDGEPDVIFYIHNGDSLERVVQGGYDLPDLSRVPYVDSYEDGVAAQMRSLPSPVAEAPAPVAAPADPAVREVAQARYDEILQERVKTLGSQMKQGVIPRGLIRDPDTKEVFGALKGASLNERWYRDFYKNFGRAPRKDELPEIAHEHLTEGYTYQGIEVEGDPEFIALQEILKGDVTPSPAVASKDAQEALQSLLQQRMVPEGMTPGNPDMRDAGFRSMEETGMALEATEIPKADFVQGAETYFGEVLTKHYPGRDVGEVYDELVAKAEEVTPDTKQAWEFDLQMFAKKKPRFTEEQRSELIGLRNQVKKINVNRLRPEFRDEIRDILRDTDWRVFYRRTATLDRLQNVQQYLEDHPDALVTRETLNNLKALDKQRVQDMTFEEAKSMYEAVLNAARLSDIENKLIMAGRLQEKEEVVDEALAALGKAYPVYGPGISSNVMDMVSRDPQSGLARSIKAAHETAETTLMFLQGTSEGVFTQHVWNPINEAATQQQWEQREAFKVAEEVFAKHDVESWSEGLAMKAGDVQIHDIPVTEGKTMRLTSAHRISVKLLSSPDNLKHLLESPIAPEFRQHDTYTMNIEDVQMVIDSMPPEELEVAEAITRTFQHLAPIVNETSVDLHGYEKATLEFYFPLLRSREWVEPDSLRALQFFTRRQLENARFMQARRGGKTPLLLRDALTAYYKYIKEATQYAAYSVPLRNAKMVMQDPRLVRDMNRRGLQTQRDRMKEWLTGVEQSFRFPQGKYERVFNNVLKRWSAAKIASNLTTSAIQIPSYLGAAVEVDPQYLFGQAGAPINLEEIKNTPEAAQLWGRYDGGGFNMETGELGAMTEMRRQLLGKETWSEKFLVTIRKPDQFVIGRIWNGVKAQVMAEHPEWGEEEVLRETGIRATNVVNRTQPTSLPHTWSHLARERSVFMRMISRFTTQLNKYANVGMNQWRKLRHEEITPNEYARNMSLIYLVIPALIGGIRMAWRRISRGPSGRPWWQDLGIQMFKSNISQIFVAGPVLSNVIDRLTEGYRLSSALDTPQAQAIDQMENIITDLFRLFPQLVTQEEYASGPRTGEKKVARTFDRLLKNATELSGDLLGIPFANVQRQVRGLLRFMTEEPEDERPPVRLLR